jgi:hypothetical protein
VVKKKINQGRGRVESVILKKMIIFNGGEIRKAKIEIDHINLGLNKKTKELNKTARTNFTIKDIEKFIKMLDGEELIADTYKGKVSQFIHRIECPITGKFFGKEFFMFFDIDYNNKEVIHTVTLIPGWKK